MRKPLVALVVLALLPLSQISANAATFSFFSNTNLTDLDPNSTGYNFNGTFTKFPTEATYDIALAISSNSTCCLEKVKAIRSLIF